jgi:hypothetical protein
MMSTPDTLPMKIALIALLLFKLQVYLTFLSLLPQANHSFYVLIASSVNSTPHGINQRPAITYQKVLFIHKIGALHTQYSLTQPQLTGVQLQQLLSTSISFPELIFTPIACIKSHGTHLWQYCSHH